MRVAALLLFAACTLDAAGHWLRIRSSGFELYTSAGAPAGREVLRRLEQIRHVFEARTRRPGLVTLPVRIFVFRSDAEFRPYQVTGNTAGYYQPGPGRDYIAMQASGDDLYRVVFHEYAHLLMRHAGIHMPVWLNEGTAEVYSTAEVGGGEVRIGGLIPAHLATLRSERLIDLATLLTVTHNSPHYKERHKNPVFYAQSWALVHMLNFSRQYRPGTPNLLTLLSEGEEPARAFEQAFGKSLSGVLNDLRSYIRQGRFSGTRIPAPEFSQKEKPETERINAADAAVALADLLIAIARPAAAEPALLRLAAEHPDRPDIHGALADCALAQNQDERARRHYERAIELGSRSARLRYDYAMVLRELGAGNDRVAAVLGDAVALEPDLFDARYMLGYLMLESGNAVAAVEHLRAASGQEPWNASVWEHLAIAWHRSGNGEQARNAALRARKLASTPESVQRAEGTLRLVESDADTIVHSVPPARRDPKPGFAQASSVARMDGVLVQVDCLRDKARLHILANGVKTFLLVANPSSVVLRNAGGVWTEFVCGPIPHRAVLVEYRAVPNAAYGTRGEVAAIEFR